jgi:hypothetical protein
MPGDDNARTVVFGAVYCHTDSAALGVVAKGLLGISGIRSEMKRSRQAPREPSCGE